MMCTCWPHCYKCEPTFGSDGVSAFQNTCKKAPAAIKDFIEEHNGQNVCIHCRVALSFPAIKSLIAGKRRLDTRDESGAVVSSPLCLVYPCPFGKDGCASCKIEAQNMEIAFKVSFSPCISCSFLRLKQFVLRSWQKSSMPPPRGSHSL